MPYAIQNAYILLAPVLFAATIYMTLGRIMRRAGPGAEEYSYVPIRWLTRTFVGGDVLSFVVQGAAAGFMFLPNMQRVGQGLVLLGLAIQVISFALFLTNAVLFNIRVKRLPKTVDDGAGSSWKQSLYMLYAVSSLILLRSVFRLVEYGGGQDGYLLGHEWTLYVFDSVPMFVVTVVFWIRWPGKGEERN